MNKKISQCMAAISAGLLISVSLLTGIRVQPAQASTSPATQEPTSAELTGTVVAAENDALRMHIDMQTGLFALENKKTGTLWQSTPLNGEEDTITRGQARMQLQSQVYISYTYREEESSTADVSFANSYAECVGTGALTVTAVKNGVRVDYRFESIGMTIPVEYRLGKDFLEAEVLLKELDEGNECWLVDIFLLPSFGASVDGDEGYLLVPDGSGALVNFQPHTVLNENIILPIYGRDRAEELLKQTTRTEDVRLPVFGTRRNSEALMGVIHQGAAGSSVKVTYRSDYCAYSAISPVVNYRAHASINLYKTSYNQTMYRASRQTVIGETFVARYYPLSGEDADYVGMAKRYRRYLTEEEALTKRILPPSMQIELYGMADITSSFFGIDYTRRVKLTTYRQAATILQELQDSGMKRLSLRYVGWTGNGILNDKLTAKATPLLRLGGSSGWETLTTALNAQEVTLYPDLDLVQFRRSGNGIKEKRDSAMTAFEKVAYQYRYKASVFSRIEQNPVMLPNRAALLKNAEKVRTSFEKQSMNTISLGTLGHFNYSDLVQTGGSSRDAMEKAVREILSQWNNTASVIGVESANAYTLPQVSCIWDMPLYSSGYDIYATDVPFYQLVLHGWITLTTPPVVQSANPQVTLLKAVETGSELLYAGTYADASILTGSRYDALYGTTYTLWAQNAKEAYTTYMPLLEKVWDQEIINHQQVADGVFVTTYANGVRVAVNYTDNPVEVEAGKICPSMNFIILQEETR